ncbi:MAG TPA: MgtC/SapB family protein [Paucimonas sp.]|nr:MgtC/SapB family protein [Paucimonas sp.]
MSQDALTIAIHLLGALAAGGVIGLERSFHGRPAGFRTHTLVCLASSLLMLITLFPWTWGGHLSADIIRTDPTRMAQGIMTGIGFLGAGVIFKEAFSVRGLTTAASIWITAAIGVLIGIGFYLPAIIATVLTLGTLSIFRKIETWMPLQSYARLSLRFDRNDVQPEERIRQIMKEHGFKVANMSYRITEDGAYYEYRMDLRSGSARNISALATYLLEMDKVEGFQLAPTSD